MSPFLGKAARPSTGTKPALPCQAARFGAKRQFLVKAKPGIWEVRVEQMTLIQSNLSIVQNPLLQNRMMS